MLASNVVHFARVLREAGIPIGSDKVVDAVRMLPVTGLERRGDWHATLASLFLTRREQQALFDEAFARFWRDPALEDRVRAMLLPKVAGRASAAQAGGRLAQALHAGGSRPPIEGEAPPVTVDASLTFSEGERLRRVDFERMTAEEWAAAKRVVSRLTLPIPEVRTRRYRAGGRGAAIDVAATLRRLPRQGGELWRLARRRRERRAPPLVVLCDISGSMHRYSRMLLHLLHALLRDRPRVQVFLFGTRLTNVTRALRDRDVDEAVAKVCAAAPDWAGGTRIGACLAEFNRHWARRVLGANAAVFLVTDGLDRDEAHGLGCEMRRLRRASRRIVWLNPLLRYEGFEPVASGIAAMRPHVDAFLPVHDLDSLARLAREASAWS